MDFQPVFFGLVLQFVSVAFPQHPQVDQIGGVGLEAGLIQGGQVELFSLRPELVEPFVHLLHHMGGVVAQVELHVVGQSRPGEVGRTGYNPASLVGHQKGLAVQEIIGQAAYLHFFGP